MNTGERQGKEPVESKGRKESGMNVHAYVTGRMRGMGGRGEHGLRQKNGAKDTGPEGSTAEAEEATANPSCAMKETKKVMNTIHRQRAK